MKRQWDLGDRVALLLLVNVIDGIFGMNKLWMSIGVTSNLLYRPNCENELEGLDHDLAKLELVQVRERVPRGGKAEPFLVPRSAKNTIWINGDNAAFADVTKQVDSVQTHEQCWEEATS